MKPGLRGLLAAIVVAVLGAVMLAGCTSYTGSKANQVRQWASLSSVSANDKLVVQDIAAIKRSIRAKQLKDVTSNCSGLVFDTGTAYGNLPSPDNNLTNELNVAYEHFANAGSSCAALGSLRSTPDEGGLGDDRDRGCRPRQGDPSPGR